MTHGYSIDQFDLQQNTISDIDHQAVWNRVALMPRFYTGIGHLAQPVTTFKMRIHKCGIIETKKLVDRQEVVADYDIDSSI